VNQNIFSACLHALLLGERLDEAKGGLITKVDDDTFNYSLHGDPEAEGEDFLGVYLSATPEVKWRVMFHGGEEARNAYRQFTRNPENGDLIAA
jgi:hypothetical protein